MKRLLPLLLVGASIALAGCAAGARSDQPPKDSVAAEAVQKGISPEMMQPKGAPPPPE
ncbi:MAG: hypothetical protein SNJ74_04385 [Fimbriimonadaceae bacterium]